MCVCVCAHMRLISSMELLPRSLQRKLKNVSRAKKIITCGELFKSLTKVMAVWVYLKKGVLSAWKANEALITNFKIIAMRRFLLEVKDQDRHSPNEDGKFNFWLISKAWNISGLFCIISGELILLIQCMKIRFTETFIKAFRVDLISRERTWSEKEIWSVSHCLSFSHHWTFVYLAFLSC